MAIVNGYTTLETVKDRIENIFEGTITSFSDSGNSTTICTNIGHLFGDKYQLFISNSTIVDYDGPQIISNIIKGVSYEIPITFNGDGTAQYTSNLLVNSQLESIINAISRQIDQNRKTRFYTVNEDRVFTPKNTSVIFIDDAVSISEVKIDDDLDGSFGTTLTIDTDYFTLPFNSVEDNVPIRALQINPSSSLCFPSSVPFTYRYSNWGGNHYNSYNHSRLSSASYAFNNNNKLGLLQPTVKITGDFGYSSTTPPPIEEVCILMVIKLWRRRDAIFGITGGGTLQQTIRQLFSEDIQLKELLDTIPIKSSLMSN